MLLGKKLLFVCNSLIFSKKVINHIKNNHLPKNRIQDRHKTKKKKLIEIYKKCHYDIRNIKDNLILLQNNHSITIIIISK